MARRAVSILILLSVAAIAGAETLLYDNGAWIDVNPVNTPTIGTTSGKSYRLPAPATSLTGYGDFGWPTEWQPNGTFDSAADDFSLTTKAKLSRIRIYAYESAATSTNRTITGTYLRLWNTAPTGLRLLANDSRIVAGFMGLGPTESDKLGPIPTVDADPLNGGIGRSIWTGVYRLGGVYDSATTRPVIALDIDVSDWPQLNAGTYWLEVAMLGSTTGQQAWVLTNERKGARAKEVQGGSYVDAGGAGTGQVDNLGRTNTRPEVDFAFELYGDVVITCNTPFADAEGGGLIGVGHGDGDVDMDDFGVFQRCYSAGAPHPDIPYCGCFDRNGDGDVDQDDLGSPGIFDTFLNCMSQPGVPAPPECAAS